MALRTEMAGVIKPSPYRNAAPKTPVSSQSVRHDVVLPARGKGQSQQRKNSAFAAVVRPHDEREILDGYHQNQGPENQREQPEDVVRRGRDPTCDAKQLRKA